MSENITANVIDKNKNPSGSSETDNENNDGFSAVILAITIVICIWIVAGFTVALYATLLLLTAHLVNSFHPHSTSNRNETMLTPSSQVCMRYASRLNSNSILDLSAIQMKGKLRELCSVDLIGSKKASSNWRRLEISSQLTHLIKYQKKVIHGFSFVNMD